MRRWLYRRLGVQSPWGLVVKAMPLRLRYWVLLDQGCKHIGGSAHPHEVVPEVTFMDVLARAGAGVE
jgi:hypothetical protein